MQIGVGGLILNILLNVMRSQNQIIWQTKRTKVVDFLIEFSYNSSVVSSTGIKFNLTSKAT